MNNSRTFDISQYGIGGPSTSNALGLAVNPINGNIFLTTVSYGGANNLWEFKSDGTLLSSVRADVYTGRSGDISGIVMARDGNLLTKLAIDIGQPTESKFESWIISMNQSGIDKKNLFINTYGNGGGGISYNPINNNIFLSSYADDKIYEVGLNGVLISSFDTNYGFADIVFDPNSGNIYGLYELYNNSGYVGPLLVTYEYRGNSYKERDTYDLKSVGINTHALAIDINNTNGYLYIQENNNRVVEFSPNDLFRIPPAT